MTGSRSNRWHFAVALVLAAVVAPGLGSAVLAGPETGAVARADAARSGVATAWFGRRLSFRLQLDRPVPFRVFTLDAPPRVVADFAGLDWSGFDPAAVAPGLRVGRIQPGWSRLVLALPAPLALRSAELVPDAGGARLEVRLARVSAADFARVSGAPPGVWPAGAPARAAPVARGNGAVTVAIDPGHGGIDPGAVRDGVLEKQVALAFARDLRDTLLAAGFRVALTRDGDDFVALDDRVAAARAAGADLLLSIHCNAVEDRAVSGAITFTRSERGSSPAALARARQENAADAVAGLAAIAPGDPVHAVLADIARNRTDARSARLAESLVAAFGPVVGLAPGYPRQAANFHVLRAPDLPSVLVELGFLSNPADRAAMTAPAWRRGAARAVRDGLEDWLATEAAAGHGR